MVQNLRGKIKPDPWATLLATGSILTAIGMVAAAALRAFGVLALLLVATASAQEHGHIWGDASCTAWDSVGRCRARMCTRSCTVAGCNRGYVYTERRCSESEQSTPWGPRPGAAPEQHEHEWDGPNCGSWSKPFRKKPECEVRHCTYKCTTCGTNGRDYMDERGDC